MKVCFFGSYVDDSFGIPSGNGGVLLKNIFKSQNVEIIECHEVIDNVYSFLLAYFKLYFKHRKIKYDVMIIPWRGILTLPLAKLIHKKPIIYFPAFSIYDTLVNDRKKIRKNSLKARLIHLVDKISCNWADIIILESFEEIKYFVNEFGIDEKKFRKCPLSADETIFFPKYIEKKIQNKFIILFFGSFIPLHGIDTIVKAATILEKYDDIVFKICGDGQTKPEITKIINENKLKNIELLGIVSKDKLIENIHLSDVCLGIFGNTLKARKVLTNKVFQILASKKPLITMESPTTLEYQLVDKKNCLLVPPANPEKLAETILFLKNDPKIGVSIANEGYKIYKEYLSMDAVGKKLISYIHELIDKRT